MTAVMTTPESKALPAWLTPAPELFDDKLRRTIPAAMQGAKRWLLHRAKQPFYTNGIPRYGTLDSPDEAARLDTFDEALKALEGGGFDGLGFALGAGWQGIDLDKVEANGLTSLVAELPGYVERSPSGKGYHAIGFGAQFEQLSSNKSGIEAYSGKRYFTVTGDQGRGDIECLGNFIASRLLPLHSSKPQTKRAGGAAKAADPSITLDMVEEMLAFISPDCSRDEWIRIGMALFHQFGEAGFALWDKWSAGAVEKYRGDSEMPQQWQSFKSDLTNPVTIASVIRLACQAGYVPVHDASDQFGPIVETDWAEPTPLPNALPPVDPFDADLLPETLRPWVMDIAHRMQCPPDFPAVAALVALSSLIGARAVVQPKARDDWQVVPNLWGAGVGRAGVKKSPAFNEALKPLQRLQAAEIELWQAAHDGWELDRRVAEMQGDANERKAKGLADKDPAAARNLLEPIDTPTEPVARRFIVNDATVEKLGELMRQNPWGVLSYRDELYGLLTSLDKQGQEGSRAFYLQSYDGNQGYTFDRIGRGTVFIPRVCLAMIGGIQPGRIQGYVRDAVSGGSGDDGLLQRFGLIVWPDIAGDFIHVDQWPDTPAKLTAWAVFERLAALQPASDTEPCVWRFSPEAQALFVEWLIPFERELRGDDLHPAMVSHLSKYRKLIPALALVFALIDTPTSGFFIHEAELRRAIAMGKYLRTHANRLYAAAVNPETTDAATLLSKIRAGKLIDSDGVILNSFTPRQIVSKGWGAGLGASDDVRKAADQLVDYGWLRREVIQSSDPMGRGRPSDRYLINPVTIKG